MKQGRRGCERNQGVKRLRKPEGAAQLGEANPVLVAARFCKRRRVRNPMGGGQEPFGSLRDSAGRSKRAVHSPYFRDVAGHYSMDGVATAHR
jgi:hypothetical protein